MVSNEKVTHTVMSKPHSYYPYEPDGSGRYTSSALTWNKLIQIAVPDVLQALENIPSTEINEPITICDYGSADGGTSMGLMMACIQSIKARYGAHQAVQIIYNDQPVNDFKSLFMHIHGLIAGPPSYYSQYDKVFVSAVGTSFYTQVVPDNTVQLGLSFTAFSESPGPLDGARYHLLCKNETQRKVWRDHAAKDWEAILLNRATELTKGGKLYVSDSIIYDNKYYYGLSPHGNTSMQQELWECWVEMRKEKKITEEEFATYQLNAYVRDEAELRAPFQEGSAVHEAGLRLLYYKEFEIRCSFHHKWMTEGKKDCPKALQQHAKSVVASVRMWANWSFLSALDDSRSAEEKAGVVDQIFQKYESRIAANPDDHSLDHYHAFMLIEKV